MIPITRQKPHVIHHGRLVCEAPGQAGSPTRPPLSIRTDQIILIIKRTGLDLDTSLLRPSKPSMAEDVDRREEWEIGAKFVSGARWLIELIVKHQPRVNFCHETSPTFTSLNLQHDISHSNTDTGNRAGLGWAGMVWDGMGVLPEVWMIYSLGPFLCSSNESGPYVVTGEWWVETTGDETRPHFLF